MRLPQILMRRCSIAAIALFLGVLTSNGFSETIKEDKSPNHGGFPNPLLGLPSTTFDILKPNAHPNFDRVKNKSEVIKLGANLFYDKRLSVDGTLSCATCHQPDRYFSDGLRVSVGVKNQSGTRNAPSLLNVMYNTSQFWDGREDTLEQQAARPFLNPREMAQPNLDSILNIIRNDKNYRVEFAKAYKNPKISLDNVTTALATFQRTLNAAGSPFDHFLYDGDDHAIAENAKRGYKLFTGAASCVKCHTIDTNSALFTDNQFHALSVGLNHIAPRLAELTVKLSGERQRGVPTDEIVLSDDDFAELGRFIVTLDPKDIGTFRTPSLRNVAKTAPYMHDGSVKTLAEAVDVEVFYRSNEQGHPLLLTPDERRDLIAFLETLTSSPASLNNLMPTQKQRKAAGLGARNTAVVEDSKPDNKYSF
ncbi:cytochrome c peroxidase [Oxalobacteraceae bacterium GrIS 1.18]